MAAPLEGIRVLDLTQGIAGPFATKHFSDYGAEVIKVERPGVGDLSRRLGPFPGDRPHPEKSGLFLTLNTGKQSVALDLKTTTGQHILRRLAEDADVVIESFRPGTLERLGLGPDVLREVSPRASLVRVSNFGQTGPYRDFNADDMLLYAMGGVLYVTSAEGRDPVKIGLYAPLFLAGNVIAAFTMGAFFGARRRGLGERADISIHEILATSMDRGGTNLVAYQYSGDLYFQPRTPQRSSALPVGVYPCADGYIHIILQLQWWPRFCTMIDRPDLVNDERLVPNLLDINYAPEVDAIFFPWVLSKTKQEAMEAGQAVGVPVAAMNTMRDVINDPQLKERNFFLDVDHPEAGATRLPGLAVRMTGTPGEVRRAPLLGEHTFEVLTQRLGYTAEEVAMLGQQGVIA
jgi:crotonobetainyl-CoA:carnitine CoA-transferase CaiB-like acyl-CoA transferase